MKNTHRFILFSGAFLPMVFIIAWHVYLQFTLPITTGSLLLFSGISCCILALLLSFFSTLYILKAILKMDKTGKTDLSISPEVPEQNIQQVFNTVHLINSGREHNISISQHQYEQFFDNMPNAFSYSQLIFSEGLVTDYAYLTVNKAHQQITGLTNIIGTKASTILNEIAENPAAFFATINRVNITGIPENFEISSIALDRWFNITVFCPDKKHLILLTHNITERKKSEERYRTHIDRISDSFVALDQDGNYTYVNKKMGEMSGRNPESLIGKNAWIEFPDLKKSAAYEAVTNSMQRQQHVYHVDYYPSLDIWYESNYYPSPNGVSIFSRDITLQKKAAAQQALFVSIVNSSNDAIFSNDLNSIITSWNKSAQQLFGYTPVEVIGKSNALLIPTNRRREEVEIISLIKQGKQVYSFETQRLKKDGTLVDISFNLSPILDENDIVIGVSKIASDISDRKRTTRALENSISEKQQLTEQLSIILNALPAHIALLNETGKIIEVNDGWQNLEYNNLFIGNKNTIGSNYLSTIKNISGPHSELGKSVAEGIELVLQKKLPAFTLEYPCQITKQLKWFRLMVTPITEKSQIGVVVMYLNITEQKLNDAELAIYNDRLATLSKAANDGIWDLNLVTNEVWWNISMYRLIGMDYTLSVPPVVKLIRMIHPADRELLLIRLRNIFTTTANFWENEVRIRLPNGNYGTILDRGYIIRDANQNPIRAVGVCIDITQQKIAAEKLVALNTQLQKRARQLQESNADLEHFAYIASHDLHEPLRMVTSFLKLLQSKYQGRLDETADTYIGFAIDGATRMRKIIYDLLEYSRVEKKEFLHEQVNLNQIISGTLLLHSNVIEETKALVTWSDLPVIQANKSAMVQLFQNLIGNALKYQMEGNTPEVNISATEMTHHWKFIITDNGIGIKPEYAEAIFIIFKRLHTRNEYSGTGIGLAICKKIVENHHGKIWVTSGNNKGTNFCFTLSKKIFI